jgi:[histone H3]-lysine36 N-dimethyltransferase SETMAR
MLHMLVNNSQEICFVSMLVGELYGFVCERFVKIMNTENFEHRSVIKFLTKEGIAPKDIRQRLVNAYGDHAPPKSTVEWWAAEFKRGRQSIEDEPRSGRPVEVMTPENYDAVKQLVVTDRRLTVRRIAETLDISRRSVEIILHEKLGISKVCARWVPRMLTPEQKADRVEASKDLLAVYESDPAEFCAQIVTGDETWIHHWGPKSRLYSKVWWDHNYPPPIMVHTQPSAAKILVTIFWDSLGVLLIDYMPHKTTINGQYYAALMDRLHESIKEKRRGKLAKGVLLLHDNAPVHTARVARRAILNCGFEELYHPPYSPDLAPSDYYLFGRLKKGLHGERYADDNALKSATEHWLESREENFYLKGIQELQKRWNKCIEVGGDYFEK